MPKLGRLKKYCSHAVHAGRLFVGGKIRWRPGVPGLTHGVVKCPETLGFSFVGAGAEYPADRGAPERGFQDRPGLLRAHQGKTEPGQRHGIDKRGRALD